MMFIFAFHLIIILSYSIFVQSISISQIQNAYITNSTTSFQSNCSTCICQCLTNVSSSSSCCYVNCFMNNNTCQVIIFPSTINPTIIISDHTSVVYKTNCANSSNITSSTNIDSTKSTSLLNVPFNGSG